MRVFLNIFMPNLRKFHIGRYLFSIQENNRHTIFGYNFFSTCHIFKFPFVTLFITSVLFLFYSFLFHPFPYSTLFSVPLPPAPPFFFPFLNFLFYSLLPLPFHSFSISTPHLFSSSFFPHFLCISLPYLIIYTLL